MIDVENVRAIDIHTHADASVDGEVDPGSRAMFEAAAEYFGAPVEKPTAEEVAAYYRERSMAAVIFAVDAEAGLGHFPVSNREVLRIAHANDDVLIPFVSVDPHKGRRGVQEARALIAEGARGFKFHPTCRRCFPTTASRIRCTRSLPRPACPRCSTPDTRAWDRGCLAAAESA